ncbi:hypothetical protein L917_03460 [Phytophthora nicotianae]|uniref:Uncharacterized protein n=1 Tax=Phytophthora nicotianae TaxID=4792 RepID=W2LSU8_PHYNI|nr:hypothetical protein L917_03460 [Phytophthora nicotianae]
MDFADAVTFCADTCLLMKTALMQQNILLYPPAKKYVAPAIMPSSWGTLSVKYFSEIRMRMYTAKLRAVGLRSFLELNQPWWRQMVILLKLNGLPGRKESLSWTEFEVHYA